jgi:4-hydroxy-2-oxoheptanedioate aldolase
VTDWPAVRPNKLKERLKKGEVVVGCLLAYDAPWLVEVLGFTGYDFVTFDLEHEPIDTGAILHLTRAAEAAGITPLVRMPCTERVLPMLTAGVQGVQIPDLRDREHAGQIVMTTRFPPRGRRTYYTQTRGAQYGIGIDETTWTRDADEELLVIGTIEDIETVEQLDDILEIDGIDAFHVGPLDLAQSMGSPRPDELEPVIESVLTRCRAAGRPVGVGMVTPWGIDAVPKRVAQGAQILTVSSAWLVTHAFSDFLSQVEDRIPGDRRTSAAKPVAQNPYFVHQR